MIRALILAAALTLASCTPAHWSAQREAASAVSQVANDHVLRALEQAYRTDGLLSVTRAETPAEKDLAFIEWKSRWLPVWAAWESLVAAHNAWVTAIETKGDVAKTGEATRDAFCTLKSNAARAGARIPDFPLLGCIR